MKPNEIEALSFQIIDREAGAHGFDNPSWQVVRRMIHTSADFEYQSSVRFSPGAVEAGISAIRQGTPIITDTFMALSGIRKKDLERYGGSLTCLIQEPAVAAAARNQGTTRALAAVDQAVERMPRGLYVVGNAPTALLRLMEKIRAAEAQPALVVGLPVGFVNAAESKAALLTVKVPHITNVGRKGGSNVAAAVINALIILAQNESN